MQLISPSFSSMPVLLGNSQAMSAVRRQLQLAASAGMPVLITGESGTGKNVVAQNLHMLSARRDRAFVQVNCPSLPHSLIESELFGHEAGAFTGANHSRNGKVEPRRRRRRIYSWMKSATWMHLCKRNCCRCYRIFVSAA